MPIENDIAVVSINFSIASRSYYWKQAEVNSLHLLSHILVEILMYIPPVSHLALYVLNFISIFSMISKIEGYFSRGQNMNPSQAKICILGQL